MQRVRWLAVGVVAALSSGLVACGSTAPASGQFHPVHPGRLTVATADIPEPGLWEGTPDAPTGGFEYGLAQAIADHLGLDGVDVVVVPFESILAGDLGGADVALSGLTATPERKEHLQFTGVYLSATPAVLVRSGQDVDDLYTAQRLSWAVARGTTLATFLADTVRPDPSTTTLDEDAAVVAAVDAGRVDAGLLDLPVAAAAAAASGGNLHVAGQFATDDSASAALTEGSTGREAVSSAIRALTADGTIADLAQKWLSLDLSGTAADKIPLIRTSS